MKYQDYKRLREIEDKENPTKEEEKEFILLHKKIFGFGEPLIK